MKYYAKYDFIACDKYPSSYLLVSSVGKAENLHLAKYTDTSKNITMGIAGKEYIHFGVPRNKSMTKYFSHTFEGFRGKPITSTESLRNVGNEKRTFGDCFCLGYKDLIFFSFDSDMKTLSMFFIRDMGNSKYQKQEAFQRWCDGEVFAYEQ